MGIYLPAGSTAQVPSIKPAQEHKYNTKTVKIHKNGMLNRQNKNNMAAVGKSNINEILGQKP
jgi:hypothetical protein